jgi:hypothetical protein
MDKQATMQTIPKIVLDNNLHVIIVLYNYCEYKIRYKLAKDFIKKYSNFPGLVLYVVELAYGDKGFHVSDLKNKRHLQLRTNDPLWHKENLINIGVKKLLPASWQYFAWIDCNLEFVNNDFVKKTIHKLKTYDVVQMFKYIKYSDDDIRPSYFYQKEKIKEQEKLFKQTQQSNNKRTFISIKQAIGESQSRQKYISKCMKKYSKMVQSSPGGAYACTKKAYIKMGSLYEHCIVGGGDSIFVNALGGENALKKIYSHGENKEYIKHLNEYIGKVKNLKVSYVDNEIIYFKHGTPQNRQYANRHYFLSDYNPKKSIIYDEFGVMQFIKCQETFDMQEKIKRMFENRKEDRSQ